MIKVKGEKEKQPLLLTKQQKDWADNLIEQSKRGEAPSPKLATRSAYNMATDDAENTQGYRNLRNANIKRYLLERLSGGEILEQKDAFGFIQHEASELLTDTKKKGDNKTRLGVLQFIGKLYGLGADRLVVTDNRATPEVEKIYKEVVEGEIAEKYAG